MDGLLLDTERLNARCFEQVADELKVADIKPLALELIGLRMDACKPLIEKALNKRARFNDFQARWFDLFHNELEQDVPRKPGVLDFLDQLGTLEIPCAIATSTPTAKAQKHLEKAGIGDFFKTVTGGDMVKLAKPAPDIYHLAAQSIGLNASDCAAFEDSDTGALAAHLSGATTVQVPDIKTPSAKIRALNHIIAPNIRSGAKTIGLI